METIFSLASLLVVPFWALMILLPRWRWTERVIASPLIIVPNALFYAVLVLPRIGGIITAFDSAASVGALLGTTTGATIAWVHFLAFDLFVGRWVYRDSRRRGISPIAMAPVLFATFMLGPLGFLLYLGLRAIPGALSTPRPQPAPPA